MITQPDIDALLAFLPHFERQNQAWITTWVGGAPQYQTEVAAFFALLAQECWLFRNYEPGESRAMLNNPALIATANWEQIKKMLTFCLRSERFSDGAWAAWLNSGKIVRLLQRIRELGPETTSEKV